MAALSGDVDVARGVPPSREAVEAMPDARGQGAPASNHIVLDTLADGPLRDVRVRQAINYGVDKDGHHQSVLEGNGQHSAVH